MIDCFWWLWNFFHDENWDHCCITWDHSRSFSLYVYWGRSLRPLWLNSNHLLFELNYLRFNHWLLFPAWLRITGWTTVRAATICFRHSNFYHRKFLLHVWVHDGLDNRDMISERRDLIIKFEKTCSHKSIENLTIELSDMIKGLILSKIHEFSGNIIKYGYLQVHASKITIIDYHVDAKYLDCSWLPIIVVFTAK